MDRQFLGAYRVWHHLSRVTANGIVYLVYWSRVELICYNQLKNLGRKNSSNHTLFYFILLSQALMYLMASNLHDAEGDLEHLSLLTPPLES